MRIHCVVAEQLGLVPLFTEGPSADLRYKFVVVDDDLVYGNVRHHWDLVKWLLQGPLSSKYPAVLAQARPIIESEKVLTVFGGIDHHGRLEMELYVIPDDMPNESVRQMIAESFQDILLDKR